MSQKDPNVLEINVAETIRTADVPPGTPLDSMTPEERNNRVTEETVRLLGRYVEPHNKVSRWVTKEDLPRVIKDATDIIMLCSLPRGHQRSAYAIAHCQIDDVDPLRFFAMPNGAVILNPVITNHTNYTVFKSEGCMSFPELPPKPLVPRYHKIQVYFQLLLKTPEGEPKLSEKKDVDLSSFEAEIFQHECAHMNGSSIYDADSTAEKAVWFGGETTRLSNGEFLDFINKYEEKRG